MPSVNKETKSTSAAADIQEPQKLVQNLVDKKIRNLEKRKTRLNELQQMAAKGQKLEPEQENAIKKLDQVIEMIDQLKDLSKSITEVLTENTKHQKRQHKKEMLEKQIERQQQEIERLKTIIKFQDILARFETTVRQDFSSGTNGAIKLTEDQLSQLDNLYSISTETSPDKIETTAEKLIALADGKSREAFPGVTFLQLKELMISIIDTKYFVTEPKKTAITPAPTNNTNTSTSKPENATNSLNASVQNGTKNVPPNQFQSVQNDFNLNQLQSQFASGISFMTDSSLDKDPAVVAVASVANNFPANMKPYQNYGNSFMPNSHTEANNPNLNQQMTTYDNTSNISTIPTQTFTNQQFAALIPSNTGFSAVPVTLAPVPVSITGLVAPDLTGQVPTDQFQPQTFGNHTNNYLSSGTDKHSSTNTSHERPNTFNDDHKNRNQRQRREYDNKKNINGTGNRPRNPNKGQSYGQNPMYNNNYGKNDYQMNGSNFGNTFTGDKSNNFRGNRGGQSQGQRPPRTDRPRTDRNERNQNYSQNFGATAAK